MKTIVMGCGRVGSQVSLLLEKNGHDVTVIDHRDADARVRLGPNFKGRVIPGLGFDHDVLLQSGVEQADAFVAASSSDNANIVAARLVRNIFHVPRVVARLYDPHRAEIYQRLGLVTISPTNWGAERIYEAVTHSELDVVFNFGGGEVSIVAIDANYALTGRIVRNLTIPGEVKVVSITRQDEAFIPSDGTEFQEGDLIHIAVLASAMPRLEELLGLERRQ